VTYYYKKKCINKALYFCISCVPKNLACLVRISYTRQFTDKPTRGHSSGGLVTRVLINLTTANF